MGTTIRAMTAQDKDEVLKMMRVFYASPAVFSNGSEEIFTADIEACVSGSPYLEGYIMGCGDAIQGYAMIAKSFSTEFGKPCIWIEDIYIKEEFRGLGIGKEFFGFITKKYEGCLFRLEVEEENTRAVELYEKCGFTELPYMEMKK
ncbi:MAG: GNAT family N-acetyltransferase [Oscillospiraceae bacterium]|nr:GNAT family N-acetyltransferase [Oscillospiraceae bacterium]